MTASGHEYQFRPPSLNGRYRLGEATFARASSNDEVAPKPVIHQSPFVRFDSSGQQSMAQVRGQTR
jgi:hypothetical protein